MTVGWGSMGSIWNRPVVQVLVRSSRHTFQFMERYDTFTLCAFSEEYRDALSLLGKKSGRDGDKISESGLTPIPSSVVAAPGFDEAELVIECRKIYFTDLNPSNFLDPAIVDHYPEGNYHRVYFGEILAIAGVKRFDARSTTLFQPARQFPPNRTVVGLQRHPGRCIRRRSVCPGNPPIIAHRWAEWVRREFLSAGCRTNRSQANKASRYSRSNRRR